MRKKAIAEIKGNKIQQINQREANLINDNFAEGLLKFTVETKNRVCILRYNTERLVSLSDFLQLNGMSQKLFIVLLSNIIVAVKSVEKNKLNKDLIVWDINASYVDPASWRVYMMYVPLQPFETTGSLKIFLQTFVSACNFVAGEDVGYVQDFVKELNAGITYTIYALEEYCGKIRKNWFLPSERQDDKLCLVCHAKLMSDETTCPFCGANFSNVSSQKASDPYHGKLSVNEDDNGVVTVFRGAADLVHTVWLVDRYNKEKISVTKFPFRVGKMEGVTDYRIHSNTVSRKHADIIREQGRYYLVDLDSTNGTYLNGKRLQPGVKEELADGFLIIFADREFEFHKNQKE